MSYTLAASSASPSLSLTAPANPAAAVASSSSSFSSYRLPRVAQESLAHLTPADRHKFEAYGLGPKRKVDLPVVHHAFERHARAQPDAVAVEHSLYHHSLTYAQLDRRANRLARRLREQHAIVPGKRVCVLVCRSVYYVIAVLAVLKAGGQYVPLDGVTITDATLHHVLSDSRAELVLVMDEYVPRVAGRLPHLCLEDAVREDEERDAPADQPEDWATPDDGCYVIYTSGTTGKPKGVDVRHRGVSNVISGSPGNVGMRPGMRVAQLLNIAFDMGAWELLGSLYNGCTLCLRGNTSREWAALMKTVDVVISTPSILQRHEPANYPNIKHVIVGGEPCPQALADKWARATAFNNCCGPTEISICNTVQRHTPGYPLSIGTPIPNTNVYVLGRDPNDTRAAAVGDVGCMWVGGAGVSRGYLNLPDKTAERLRPDPFLGGAAMMFNTGDLGRWRADGQLDHMGRADDQVKVKGFRVELDGVGAAMRAHADVRETVALLVGGALWGFLTPATVDLATARAACAELQPYYAVPTEWVALDAFPTTKNGKVDKRALRDLAEAQAAAPAGADSTATSDAAAVKKETHLRPPAPHRALSVDAAQTAMNASVVVAEAAAAPTAHTRRESSDGLPTIEVSPAPPAPDAARPRRMSVRNQPFASSLPGTPYIPAAGTSAQAAPTFADAFSDAVAAHNNTAPLVAPASAIPLRASSLPAVPPSPEEGEFQLDRRGSASSIESSSDGEDDSIFAVANNKTAADALAAPRTMHVRRSPSVSSLVAAAAVAGAAAIAFGAYGAPLLGAIGAA